LKKLTMKLTMKLGKRFLRGGRETPRLKRRRLSGSIYCEDKPAPAVEQCVGTASQQPPRRPHWQPTGEPLQKLQQMPLDRRRAWEEERDLSDIKDVEIREVPAFGRGLFACRDFNTGDVVLQEKPFLRFSFDGLSDGYDGRNMIKRFKLQDVSPEWRTLAAVVCQAFHFAGRLGLKDPLETSEFQDLVAIRQPSPEEETVLTTQILPVVQRLNADYTLPQLFDLYSVIASNAYGSGLYRIVSFINHSCHPNTVWQPYQNRKNAIVSSSKTIQAVAPIKKGEQLFISYADYQGFDLSLLGNLGIHCQNDPESFEKTRKCLCCAGRNEDSLRQVFDLSD